MYTLTLSREDRKDFDSVAGTDVTSDVKEILIDCLDHDQSWGDEEDITIHIPDFKAWEIDRLARADEFRFHFFSEELRAKIAMFCVSLV